MINTNTTVDFLINKFLSKSEVASILLDKVNKNTKEITLRDINQILSESSLFKGRSIDIIRDLEKSRFFLYNKDMKKKLISILCVLLLTVIPIFAQTSDTLTVVLNLEAMTTVEWFIGETEPNFDNWEYDVDKLILELDEDNLTNPVWLGILTNEENLGTLSISGTALLKDGTETTDIIPLVINKGQNTSASVLKEFTASTSELVDVEYTDETGTGYRIIPIPLEIVVDYNDVITKTAPSTYETTLTATYTVTD